METFQMNKQLKSHILFEHSGQRTHNYLSTNSNNGATLKKGTDSSAPSGPSDEVHKERKLARVKM